MPLYCGVNGVRREIRELYTGVGGARKQLSEMWSSEGGVKKLVYQSIKGTPIGELPVGSIVKMGNYYNADICWIIADHNHEGYPENSTTLVSERILTFKCIDASEGGGNADRQTYGNNRYIWSNIRQWLNKSGTGWYKSQHTYDRPPFSDYVQYKRNAYESELGFLSSFSQETLDAILITNLVVAKCAALDGGESDTFQDKIFLLSLTEINSGDNRGVTEGHPLALFSDNESRKAYPTPECVENNEVPGSSISELKPYSWALRSPESSKGRFVRLVTITGTTTSALAAYSCYHTIRPALNLSSDILVSDNGFVLI